MTNATLFGLEQEVATSDDYYTPSWLFEDMAVKFDLDVAAPPGGVPWIPCKRYYTMADDGLAQPWEGKVWMNPPYSNAAPWAREFIDHGNGVALLPYSQGKWLYELWIAVDGVAMLPTQPLFVGGTSLFRVALFAFGDWAVEAITRIGHVR